MLSGSPPRTRGARTRPRQTHLGPGITPAYAGSTSTCRRRPSPTRDHPRVRGEHDLTEMCRWLSSGSPPRTRGALRQPDPAGVPPGITPAYAGSTQRRRTPAGSAGDHPRVRGEHPTPKDSRRIRRGSPPRTRGAPAHGWPVGRGAGITPAYAGSTQVSVMPQTIARDHPRVRGEHHAGHVSVHPGQGSPPRTRGALSLTCCVVDQLFGFCSVWSGGALPHAVVVGVRRPNRRRLAALLHPRGSAGLGVVRSVGRRMRVRPSKSTGFH